MKNKERVVEVVAHELAHQWFGNLVTMDWWTDLWYVIGHENTLASVKTNFNLQVERRLRQLRGIPGRRTREDFIQILLSTIHLQFEKRTQVEPSLKWHQQFVTKELQDVMSLDSLESSHPISIVVHHPNEINEIFDRISYGKGATIIRMLEAFIGEKTFQQGLTNYLKSR